jgi:hypothetical protein
MLQWSPRVATLLLVLTVIAAVLACSTQAGRSFGWG